MKVLNEEKKQVGTVDIIPTWSGLLPVFIAVMRDGYNAAREVIFAELERMAEVADKYVELQKRKETKS